MSLPRRIGPNGRRYIDYFANTSLDESDTTFAPPALGQGRGGGQEPRVRNTRTAAQRARADVEYEDRRARREAAQRALDRDRNENPRLTRFENCRSQTEALAAKLHSAVATWAMASPAAAKDFDDFVLICLTASCTAVRAADMVLKQTTPPAELYQALRDLTKQTHKEARLKFDYQMVSVDERYIHPEITHAADNTDVSIRRCPEHGEHIDVNKWTIFGSGPDYRAWAVFPNYHNESHYNTIDDALTPRQVLLKIQANFIVRTQVMLLKTNYRFPKTVFESSYDFFVMEWFMKANHFLKTQIPLYNNASVSRDDKKLFHKVFNQIKSHGDERKWFVIHAMRAEVFDYIKKVEQVKRLKENPQHDKAAVARMESLLIIAKNQFFDFETAHGKVLGEAWR